MEYKAFSCFYIFSGAALKKLFWAEDCWEEKGYGKLPLSKSDRVNALEERPGPLNGSNVSCTIYFAKLLV